MLTTSRLVHPAWGTSFRSGSDGLPIDNGVSSPRVQGSAARTIDCSMVSFPVFGFGSRSARASDPGLFCRLALGVTVCWPGSGSLHRFHSRVGHASRSAGRAESYRASSACAGRSHGLASVKPVGWATDRIAAAGAGWDFGGRSLSLSSAGLSAPMRGVIPSLPCSWGRRSRKCGRLFIGACIFVQSAGCKMVAICGLDGGNMASC